MEGDTYAYNTQYTIYSQHTAQQNMSNITCVNDLYKHHIVMYIYFNSKTEPFPHPLASAST